MNIINYSSRQVIVFVSIFICSQSFSANRFWVGTGIGLWNTTANWSDVSGGTPGFSVPGFTDIANFDGGNINICQINTNVSVAGFNITALYAGTISVNTGITTTIGASGFSQAAGTFTGSNGNVSINGAFLLTSGVFNATTGIVQITGGYTFSGGTFNHNNGTVSFSTSQTITGNTNMYNILFVAGGGVYTIAVGTIITSINNVTVSGSASYTINTGVISLKGNLTLTSSSNNSVNGGSATFLFDGTGPQNINSAITSINVGTNERVCALPNIEINKTSGTLNLNGVITVNGSTWTTTAGAALINAGTSTINLMSSITFTGQNLSLYNIHIYSNSQIITFNSAAYILTATNDVIINGSSYYTVNIGTIEIMGNLNLIGTSNSALNGGTGKFLFDGTGIQNITSTAPTTNFVCALPKIEINKTSSALNLIGFINFNGSSWNTVAGGSLVNAGTSVVNILATSTLSGQNLSLYDITVTANNSTITISSGVTWTSTHLITLAGGTTWYNLSTGTLNAKGDVTVTNTNTSNNVGGNAILLFDGSANQLLTGSGTAGGGRLPQVQINKSGGTLTLSNAIISTDNNWTYTTGTVDATTNASTLDFYKTSNIDGQGSSSTMAFNNVIFSGFISLGGNMVAKGNLTIRTGVNNRLDVDATLNYQLNIGGNWANNNSVTTTSFNQQNGKVVFDGGSSQAIATASSSDIETYYNLEVNKTGSNLTLNAPITISNNINFVVGNILSSSSQILLINNGATVTGASNNSFVSGPVRKTGNQAFTFPVGKNVVFAPIAISAPAVNTHQFTAEYFQTDPNSLYNVSSKDTSLGYISRCEYWILDRTIGTSNVTASLSWDTRSCSIVNLTNLRVARWDGAQWKDHGNGGTTGTIVSGTIVSSGVVTSFSPFTLASVSRALPIELIDFSAECRGRNAVIHWSTASEANNDYFVVERSRDAINWKNIGTVDGAGHSSAMLNYVFTDAQPFNGIFYYRLKQTDFDGKFKYSNYVVIEDCINATTGVIVYPNPTHGILNFSSNGVKEKVRSIEVYNNLGERIYNSTNYQPSIDLSGNQSGTYLVRINLGSKIITKNIVVEN